MTDDPERLFRRFPAVLRRWNWRAVNRRLRLPLRRHRWDTRNRQIVKPYLIRDCGQALETESKKIVVVCGDFSGRTGLSRAAIYELEKLREEYPGLIVRDFGAALHGIEDVRMEDGPPIDRLYLLSAPDTYPTLLRGLCPKRLCGAHRIGLWVWETPIFPKHWRFAINLVDEIWTPSEYSRRAIAATVSPIPVILRPHAVETTPPLPGAGHAIRARFAIPRKAFAGLAIMDIVSCPARKNPWAHVVAWQRAFGDDPEAVLLLKIRVSKGTRVVLHELSEMIGTATNIRIIEAELTDTEILALQSSADVYLSLHRAEGYGLNIHECLNIGTPVVATNFSANAEYGPQFPGYHPVPYRLVAYRDWTNHYADRDFRWAEADIDASADILRNLRALHFAPLSEDSASGCI